jgi:hypothetical protein
LSRAGLGKSFPHLNSNIQNGAVFLLAIGDGDWSSDAGAELLRGAVAHRRDAPYAGGAVRPHLAAGVAARRQRRGQLQLGRWRRGYDGWRRDDDSAVCEVRQNAYIDIDIYISLSRCHFVLEGMVQILPRHRLGTNVYGKQYSRKRGGCFPVDHFPVDHFCSFRVNFVETWNKFMDKVRKRHFCAILYINDDFTKTGSGKTPGKLKKGPFFPQLRYDDLISVSENGLF